MIGWFIFLGIIIFLFLLLLFPIKFNIFYEETLLATFKYLFFSFKFPMENENKAEPKNDSINKKIKKKVAKRKSNKFLDIIKGKGLKGFLRILKETVIIAKDTLKSFFKHLVIDEISLNIAVAGEDAAQTAVTYGKVCAIVYPALNVLVRNTPKTNYNVFIYPNFSLSESKVTFKMQAHVKLIYIVACGIKALFNFIMSLVKK